MNVKQTACEKSVKPAKKQLAMGRRRKGEGVERKAETVTRCLSVADLRRRPGLIVEHARTLVQSRARTGTLDAGSEDATLQAADSGASLWLRVVGYGMVRQAANAHTPVPARGEEHRGGAFRSSRRSATGVELLSCGVCCSLKVAPPVSLECYFSRQQRGALNSQPGTAARRTGCSY